MRDVSHLLPAGTTPSSIGHVVDGAACLVDTAHYGKEARRNFSGQNDACEHYRSVGQHSGLNPSPFFYTGWYMWQHPEAAGYSSPLDHFAEHGARHWPAPFIDPEAFLADHPQYHNMQEAMLALVRRTDASCSPDIETHLELLHFHQTYLHKRIRAHVIKNRPAGRRNLVWVQAGPRFDVTRWFRPDAPRSWDLLCNWYSRDCLDLAHGEIHLCQPGTKVTGIRHVLKNMPGIFSPYEYILFIDDDIIMAHEDIDRLFDIAGANHLELFQPALLPGSHGAWPGMFRQQDEGVRPVSAVEIMMPGFSRETLFACREYFDRNVSGYGLDFLFSEHVRALGGKCAVIDSVGAEHSSPINETDGAYYRFLRKFGINQHLELFEAIMEVGAYPTFHTLAAGEHGLHNENRAGHAR